ncbi:MAG: preprotein translocase subunit SecY [Clostridia bacterium]|nr:preprotein translocase subunit SecY [Clostridia bacterium]
MFNTIKNALKTPDVRRRLLFTLLLIIVFRLGCFISVPGIDPSQLKPNETDGIKGLINLLTGGAFTRLSVFAMSITPYITASIVIQLLGMVIPSLEKLTKEGGELERAKINRYTKILTLFLSLAEGVGIYLMYKPVFINPGFLTGFLVVLSFMTGTAILMWLGEQITSKGIGNGISMIIFVGIVAGLGNGAKSLYNTVFGTAFDTKNLLLVLGIIVGVLLLVAAVVFVQQAERRIPVQYSKKVVGRKMVGGQNTHIPLKLAMAGVMPIIFASSFMTFPAMVIQLINPNIVTQTTGIQNFWRIVYNTSIATSSSDVSMKYTVVNAIIYVLLIVGFTFFYTYATFNPAEISSSIKKNGGFIPGIRTGKSTTEYLSSVITKLTIFGGFFLAMIAIIPMLFSHIPQLASIAFGGTSILIVVGVALETVQQLESQVAMKHYKGFLE